MIVDLQLLVLFSQVVAELHIVPKERLLLFSLGPRAGDCFTHVARR